MSTCFLNIPVETRNLFSSFFNRGVIGHKSVPVKKQASRFMIGVGKFGFDNVFAVYCVTEL